jgi:ubiquinone/menaquinone biosynthesis C-methylase UbiE
LRLRSKPGTRNGGPTKAEPIGSNPNPKVIALLPELKARGTRTALDLGCGVGRHALLLAEHGLAVEAIDGSAAGLKVARETAQARGIALGLRQGNADALPFDNGSFDFVLCGT